MSRSERVLLLPGWLDGGPTHWQNRWSLLHGHRRVEQADWTWPRRGDWMARLDEAVCEVDSKTLLVAHGLGCQLVAAWAAHSRHTARVGGALLVAPPDTERADTPPQWFGWRPIVRTRLPFGCRVVYSNDDPFATPEQATTMATDWGAEITALGERGHIDGDSGLGDWPAGLALLAALKGPA